MKSTGWKESSMGEDTQETSVTQKLDRVTSSPLETLNSETPLPPTLTEVVEIKRETHKWPATLPPKAISRQDRANMSLLQERFRHMCLATFFRKHKPVRSLGITSAIDGEGKSLVAMGMAQALADMSNTRVILLECNWEHKSLQRQFDLPEGPGLAEWLRGECNEDTIRYEVHHNLTVIPAGESEQDTIKLLQQIQQRGLRETFAYTDEFLIVDLPAIVATAYGAFAANLLEAVAIVVKAGVTPADMLKEACTQLGDMQVEGFILNEARSKIPGWLQSIL